MALIYFVKLSLDGFEFLMPKFIELDKLLGQRVIQGDPMALLFVQGLNHLFGLVNGSAELPKLIRLDGLGTKFPQLQVRPAFRSRLRFEQSIDCVVDIETLKQRSRETGDWNVGKGVFTTAVLEEPRESPRKMACTWGQQKIETRLFLSIPQAISVVEIY